jgi:glucose uptake protein
MAAPADPTQQRSASSATANVGVHKGHRSWPGTAVAAALGAGVLWGSYFIPIQAADVAPAAANLPLAAGMVAGALVLAALTDGRLARLRTSREEILVVGAGVLWGVGNLGMLLLVDRIGAGRGFAIAQLGLIVNALIGIVAFQNPRPGSRAATVTLCGVVLAAIGGVLVGLSQ